MRVHWVTGLPGQADQIAAAMRDDYGDDAPAYMKGMIAGLGSMRESLARPDVPDVLTKGQVLGHLDYGLELYEPVAQALGVDLL